MSGSGVANKNTPNGWNVTAAGEVTAPANASWGEYDVRMDCDYYNPAGQPAMYWRYTQKALKITIVFVKMQNPAGDPTKATEQKQGTAANGYIGNEFTFDASAEGICLIRCEAKLDPPSTAARAWAEQNVEWTVADVAGSKKEWVNSPCR